VGTGIGSGRLAENENEVSTTAMVARAEAPLAVTCVRIFSREGWWHAELDHGGKTWRIGRFGSKSQAARAAERWRKAVLGIEDPGAGARARRLTDRP